MESLSTASLKNIHDFTLYFQNNNLEEKLSDKEDGLNIMQWALCQMNYDVVKFLMDYGYDLETELNTVIMKSMSLNKVLPAISLFKENHGVFSKKIKNADFESYQKIIELCNKEKINFEPISYEDIKRANVKDYQKAQFIQNPEYVIALQNNCFEDDLLLKIIELFLYKNVKEISKFYETLKKLQDNDNFVMDFSNYSKFFIWISEIKESPIKSNTVKELAQALMKSEEISEMNEVKKLMFKDMLIRFNSMSLSQIINIVNEFDGNNNVMEICINQDLITEIISGINTKADSKIPVRYCIKRYSEIVDIKPELENHTNIVAQLNKNIYCKDYMFNNYNIKDFRYEQRNCWEKNGNNIYFDIFPDNREFFRLLENQKNKEIDLFRNSFFYTYLQLAEDIKIDRLFRKSKQASLSEANHDYNLADIYEKLSENLFIDFNKDLFKKNVQVIFNSTYNSNYITDKNAFDDNSSRLIKYIFNSKLTLSEIENEIINISVDKNVSLKKTVSDYLMTEKEIKELSFLYNEANSMEKIELLKSHGISEPDMYNGVNILHNLSMNEDEEFKKHILTKNIKITEEDLLIFMRNIGVWSFYEGKAGNLYEFFAHSFGAIDTLNELLSSEDNYTIIENAENLSDFLFAVENKSNLLQENIYEGYELEPFLKNQIPASVVITNYEKYLINKTVQIKSINAPEKKSSRL